MAFPLLFCFGVRPVPIGNAPDQKENVMFQPKRGAVPGALRTSDYLTQIGVRDLPSRSSPFDPGYDPLTLASHLEQSGHLISTLKISMACWMVANERSTRNKIAAASSLDVPTVTGGGPFEVAVAQGKLSAYLDLCADIGVTRIEAGAGFTEMRLKPATIVAMANQRGLEVQFELGKKHDGPITEETLTELVSLGHAWLDAGAVQLVIEARESAQGVGLFDEQGRFQPTFADVFAREYGFDIVTFEAPNKASQFAFIDHFGPQVGLCNIRLEELLRVEIYRRGLHSDAFGKPHLRPAEMTADEEAV